MTESHMQTAPISRGLVWMFLAFAVWSIATRVFPTYPHYVSSMTTWDWIVRACVYVLLVMLWPRMDIIYRQAVGLMFVSMISKDASRMQWLSAATARYIVIGANILLVIWALYWLMRSRQQHTHDDSTPTDADPC